MVSFSIWIEPSSGRIQASNTYLAPFHRGGLLLRLDLGEIIRDRIVDGVVALAQAAGGHQPLALAPLPRLILGLPVIEDRDAIGVERCRRRCRSPSCRSLPAPR